MITETDDIFTRYYPGDKHNKTKLFFDGIRKEITPESLVLNLGAGPGTGSQMTSLKGEVAKVVGADIDPAVMDNEEVDEAHVIGEDGRLPFDDQSFDLVFSDFVVEHVEHPQQFFKEVLRVLKPEGSFHFRTPNLYHYVTLVSRLTPHWFHELVANRSRGIEEVAQDPYPTFYRLNTTGAIRKMAQSVGYTRADIQLVEGHPSYLVFSKPTFLAGVAYERLVNSTDLLQGFRSNIIARLAR